MDITRWLRRPVQRIDADLANLIVRRTADAHRAPSTDTLRSTA
ncbi:Uncharacterised protein [Vibrio cholerae]|nr:Uncharacterised protein [Vibrio cholerae]